MEDNDDDLDAIKGVGNGAVCGVVAWFIIIVIFCMVYGYFETVSPLTTPTYHADQ